MSSKKRILAVDDDATALNALRQILAQRGYEVLAATSGEDALEIIEREAKFDLFILDVTMPGISGLDVCRKVRANPKTENAPVIFLTARGMVNDMIEGRAAGSDLYLVKPVLASKILTMVGMFLSSEIPLSKKPRSAPGSS